jgi:hypothetical protein
VIAQLVQADEDTVRVVIHRFNEIGLAALDPRWAGGRPRLLSPDDEDAAYLRKVHGRVIRIGREALRCLLARRGITFQRTKTWKESPDPDRDTKLDRIEMCFTPTYASWANPIEAHFGPLRQFTIANSDHRNHTVRTRALHAYLRWRNKNARHPDVLAAQRKERARIRSEKGLRWGGQPQRTATLGSGPTPCSQPPRSVAARG